MRLAVQDHRVDRAAHVVDGGIAHHVDGAGLGVDLDLADLRAVGEAGGAHLLGMLGREGLAAGLGRACDLEQGDAAVGAENREPAGIEHDILDCRLQHVGRDRLRLLDHQLGGAAHDDPRHAHRARRMRPAAFRDDVGVAGHQANAVEGHPEPVGDALGEGGLVPLPARQRADHDFDQVRRPHFDPGALDGKARGDLDRVGEPDAAQPAARPRLGAPRRKPVPVGEAKRPVHRLLVVAAVIGEPERRPVGHGGGRNQVAPAQRHRVETVLARGEVDQPLHRQHRLGPAGAAIRRGGRGVRHHRPGADMGGGKVVDGRRQLGRLGDRHEGHRVAADIGEQRRTKREEIALRVERQRGVYREVAALVVGEEGLAPARIPFDGAAEPPGRPQGDGVLGIGPVPGAVIAADIARDDAHPALLHPEHGGDVALDPDRVVAAAVEGESLRLRVVDGDRRARLHHHPGHPLHPGVERNDMRRGRERRLGRLRIAEIAVDANIAGDVVPELRRAGRGRRPGVGDRIERLVGDRDPFRRIGRGGRRLADRDGDDVAHETHPLAREHRQRRPAPGRAVGVFEHQVDQPGDQGIARDRPDRVAREVGGGEHVDGARRRARRRGVDAGDAGMRVRRAQHHGMSLPGEGDVVGIAPAPAQQPQILLPENRLSDPAGLDRRLRHCRKPVPKCRASA